MASLSGELSLKMGAVSGYRLKLLRQIDGASLESLRRIVDEKAKSASRSEFAIAGLPDSDRAFFENHFYAGGMKETKDAIAWRLCAAALKDDTFRRMFTASSNCLDAYRAMEQKDIVLVNGSPAALTKEAMPVFLQFIVSQFYSAPSKREKLRTEDRHTCILIVDEAKHVFNMQVESLLTECRKYGLASSQQRS